MAFYSLQCAACTDSTKRCAGKYITRERSGRPCSGDMYTCTNEHCRVTLERLRGEHQLRLMEAEKRDRLYRY